MQENGVSAMRYDVQFGHMGDMAEQLINNRMTGDFRREAQHYTADENLDVSGFELSGGDDLLTPDSSGAESPAIETSTNTVSGLKM